VLDFSIIIPTYNRKDFLGNTIESALGQKYGSYEIILVDDGSTDGTEEFIMDHFADQLSYVKQKNLERGAARNQGAKIAKGEYLYFLDSDDLLYPHHLSEARDFIAKFEARPEWFFQEYEITDGEKQTRVKYDRKSPLKTLIEKGNFMSCHGVFVRREIFHANTFREDRHFAGSEDYELWLRLAARYSLHINPKITSALVQHEERSVFNFSLEKIIDRKNLFLKCLKEDHLIQSKFGSEMHLIRSNTFSYIALHASMIKEKEASVKYLVKSIKESASALSQKRFWATLKHLLLQ